VFRAGASLGLWRCLTEGARRHRNLLLVIGVVALIAATLGVRQSRQRRQDLPRIVSLGRVEGLAALDEGDFDKAYQLLSRARDAVDSLGGAVDGADQIRQGAAEAEIFNRLVSERLESILVEAGSNDPKLWPAHFATHYKDRSVIIDAHVVNVPDANGHGRYELDYQILPDGEEKPDRLASIDTTGFRLFTLSRPKIGDQVTFGARLASFAYDYEAKQWLVGLEPNSGVFVTHPKALQALGWPNVADRPTDRGTDDP
jgi:hypothetical protein